MKILFIAVKYHRGNPSLGYSFEYTNFYNSLLNLGGNFEIIYFPFDQVMTEKGKNKMNEKLIKVAEAEKPNLCFFYLVADEIKKETIRTLTSKFTTLNWFGDDEWRFETFSKFYAPCLTWIVTTAPAAKSKYLEIGCPNVLVSNSAANTSIFKPIGKIKDINVSFIGSYNKKRDAIIRTVKAAGINILVKGNGWPDGRVGQNEMIDFISRSKISLNLNPSSQRMTLRTAARLFLKRVSFDESLKSIRPDFWNFFKNLNEWQGKKIPQLKARVFEVPACRTLLITQNHEGLEKFYNLDKEIVTYKTTEDLVEKIKYYLHHSEKREAIALAGYKRTIQDHTYEKRFRDIFTRIGLKL
ncbi:MAG: glycosyltransferase [bacterium]|nr:glycosyltransferase [bacterium]